MSHHSKDDFEHNPIFEEMFSKIRGEFPQGRLNASDEGAQLVAIGHENGRVVIEFPTPTKWIGFMPDQAIDMANSLIEHARKAGSTKPLTVKIG